MQIEVVDKSVVSDEDWSRSMKLVLGRTDDVCQGLVVTSYIKKDALSNANFLAIAYTGGREVRGKQLKLLAGFLIANEVEFKWFLYIDVVCANQPGLGRLLLETAEARAMERNLKGLVLSSLPHVVGYYRRLGYENKDSCAMEDPELSKQFVTLAKPLIDEHKANLWAHIYDASDSAANYRRYLSLLMRKNLAKNKSCKTLEHCNKDGFIMTKCLEPGPENSRATAAKTAPAASKKTVATASKKTAAKPAVMKKTTATASKKTTATRTKKTTTAAATNPKKMAVAPSTESLPPKRISKKTQKHSDFIYD